MHWSVYTQLIVHALNTVVRNIEHTVSRVVMDLR